MPTRPLYDIVALIARFGVGVVFAAHGWDKIRDGIDQTAESFGGMGIPFAQPAAVYTTFVELLGGVALVAGIGLPIAGSLLFLDMAGAFVLVHAENGLFVSADSAGYEQVLVLGLVSLLFACGGGGRLTADRVLFGRSAADPAAPRAPQAKKAKSKDEPSDTWVKDLPEERPLDFERTSPADPDSAAGPGGEATGSSSDVLVAGNKTPRRKTSGATRRGSSATGKSRTRSTKPKGGQNPG